MGTSSSSINRNNDSNVEAANERFNFHFTDCSCKCDANKKRLENDISQTAFLNVITTQMNHRAQYDIRCDCDCGDGVKMGFLFGNTQQ